MVRVGHFTVNLVRADTKEVFKEHTGPDNNTYAEVEPGVDYFIRVESTRGKVIVKTKVDGVQIHRKSHDKPFTCKYVGNWERTNGETKTMALHFSKATQATKDEESEQTNPSMLTGKVEVKFYEFGEQTLVIGDRDVAPKQLSSDMKVGGKKCVLSGTGSHVIKHKPKRGTNSQRLKYRKGKRYAKLHYIIARQWVLF